MRLIILASIVLAFSASGFSIQDCGSSSRKPAGSPQDGGPSQNPENDVLKAELFKIYQQSHTVKMNRDREGYNSVYSRSRMEQLKKIMQEMHLSSFEEYMLRVSELEKRSPAVSKLIPQLAGEAGNKAVLTISAPKACGEAGRERDCLIAVDFVKEDGVWKIDREVVLRQR